MNFMVFFLFVLHVLNIYYFSNRKFNYWKIRNVPYVKPLSFFGNYRDFILLKQSGPIVTQRICKLFPNEPIIGAFYGTEPSLIVKDLELIKTVITKNFYYFNSREVGEYTDKEPLTQNLFFTQGDKWRVVRQNLTPLFTTSKMKNMFYLIEKCTHSLEAMLDFETSLSPVLDVHNLMARYTMDSIGSCAFGVETNTMNKSEEPNAFGIIGGKIFEQSINRGIKLVVRAMWPAFFYSFGFQVFPYEVIQFFKSLLLNVFKSRQNKPSSRNDFVDLVLSFKQNQSLVGDSMSNFKTGGDKKVHLEINDELLTAQCVLFFAAGYETSATTLKFSLYELAKNEKSQEKLIQEIDNYLRRHNGKIGYECIKELPYAEAVLDETLRLYPVLGVITRELVEDYVLPTGLQLDKGMRIHIPVYHLHHDPDHFPEPEMFQPERFLGERREMIKPYSYLPFGEGPRICIGMRFAKMQMLAGLVALFRKYRVETTSDTPDKIFFDPTAIVTASTKPVMLKFIRRSDQLEINSNNVS
ncbi:cytochrome P450 6B2-like [Battus philenor]|uniref:cytochrome P450 6B2-like n=1 Tax=Battus philenor TaxID=42288 RepID=UPI0035CFAC65